MPNRINHRQREDFIAALAREGIGSDVGRYALRQASTLIRLAEAQCNGDWPADNGERKVTPCGGAEDKGCGSFWVPSTLAGPERMCPDCRAEKRLRDTLETHGVQVETAGDPRGWVVRLKLPSGRECGV